MVRFILRRLALIPVALALLNFIGFAYAHLARPLRAARNPLLAWMAQEQTPLLPTYARYLKGVLHLDLGVLPATTQEPIATVILRAGSASLGLLALVLGLSVGLGLLLGFVATRVDPPRTVRWLTVLSTIGIATPSFYLGSLLTLALLYTIIQHGRTGIGDLPTSGFGWDKHLVLPTLTLLLRPVVQLAQTTSNLLVGELNKQYVVTARSFGVRWAVVRRKHALRNILATLILSISSSFRLLMGELILVEWLFRWPGLGQLLAATLVPAEYSGSLGGALFLDPPTVAALFTVFAALFLGLDALASVVVRAVDPRLSVADQREEARHV